MLDLIKSKVDLIVHSTSPFNAEPSLARLRSNFITDYSDFYVRSHGTIPHLDASRHEITVGGNVEKSLNLSIDDLKGAFDHQTIVAVMQCAGNRRADMHRLKPVTGDPWEPGAIGNAEWTGVRLSDVLKKAGVDEDAQDHVAFGCCDDVEIEGEGRFKYGASIPLSKAMAPEVLLAFAMNGKPLAPEHGFPLRVVVPGYAGVRSPKWLKSITVQSEPSDNHMQQRDYKLLPPDMTKKTLDWSKGFTIDAMPLNAAICEPAASALLMAGQHRVLGYAIATEREVKRVDVSGDGGESWVQADIKASAAWSWTFWSAVLDLAAGEHELVVRAWDAAGQTQPSSNNHIWNFKGYLSAAWHRVAVTVQ